MSRCSLAIALVLLQLPIVGCSNWAQATGANRQNVVWSASTPWSRRYGFATTVIQQFPPSPSPSPGAATTLSPSPLPALLSPPSLLLVMGGEGHKGDTRGSPAFGIDMDGRKMDPNYPPVDPSYPDEGGGGLMNDVYYTHGASFNVYTDHRMLGPYGDPSPQIVSNTTWGHYPDWEGGYTGGQSGEGFMFGGNALPTWKEYLSCCYSYTGDLSQRSPKPFAGYRWESFGRVAPPGWGSVSGPFMCASVQQTCFNTDGTPRTDFNAGTRRWSPRSGAAAVTAYDNNNNLPIVFIMGGRARSFSSVPRVDLNGGFLGSFVPPAAVPSIPHESVTLMNDVWFSLDLGKTWSFTNPGCWVSGLDESKEPGTWGVSASCNTDDDCVLRDLGDAKCDLPTKRCVCTNWSPRERFAAAVQARPGITPIIFISGGIGYSDRMWPKVTKPEASFKCGKFACGREFGVYLQDVWYSSDFGKTWSQLNKIDDTSGDPSNNAVFSRFPSRSDHAMIWAQGAKYWMILGGRGMSPTNRAQDVLLGDIWTVGEVPSGVKPSPTSWVEKRIIAPFFTPLPPRAAAVTATTPGQLFVFGGSTISYVPPPPIEYDDVALVAHAAALAPTNIIASTSSQSPPTRLPGEFVNGLHLAPVSDVYMTYLSDESALTAPFHGAIAGRFYLDFNNSAMPQYTYMHSHWPLSMPVAGVLNISASDLATMQLYTPPMLTIMDLASLSKYHMQQYLNAKTWNVPDICSYLRGAQALVAHCEVAYRPYDGWWASQLLLEPGTAGAKAPPSNDDDGYGSAEPPPPFTSCPPAWATVKYPRIDFVCRSAPRARRSGGMAFMDDLLYTTGGWEDENYYANDLWVRDETLPIATITLFPVDLSDNTILDVNCSKPVCVFEARFFASALPTESSLLRNWSRIEVPYDTINALSKSGNPTRVEVRAIDPAGNKDNATVYGRNAFVWTYKAPFPVLAVVLGLVFLLLLLLFALWYYRRWLRRRALEAYMRRRAARRLREADRDARSLKKVKKLKRMKRHVLKRNKADNAISEMDAHLRNQFKGILRNRTARGRAERFKAVDDPLAAPPLTTPIPTAPVYEAEDVWNVGRRRTAKEALAFDERALVAGTRGEVAKLRANFTMEVGNARRSQVDVELGRRGNMTADVLRSAIQVHSDTVASKSHGLTDERLSSGLVGRFAAAQARLEGRPVESALDRSKIQAALNRNKSTEALEAEKAALIRASHYQTGGRATTPSTRKVGQTPPGSRGKKQ